MLKTKSIAFFKYNISSKIYEDLLFQQFLQLIIDNSIVDTAIFCDVHNLSTQQINIPIFHTKYLSQSKFNLITDESDDLVADLYPTNKFITSSTSICNKNTLLYCVEPTMNHLSKFLEENYDNLI
jgi:hypothetical protein